MISSVGDFVAGIGWVSEDLDSIELEDNLDKFASLMWFLLCELLFVGIGSIGWLTEDGKLAKAGISPDDGVVNFCNDGVLGGTFDEETVGWDMGDEILGLLVGVAGVGVVGWAPAPYTAKVVADTAMYKEEGDWEEWPVGGVNGAEGVGVGGVDGVWGITGELETGLDVVPCSNNLEEPVGVSPLGVGEEGNGGEMVKVLGVVGEGAEVVGWLRDNGV